MLVQYSASLDDLSQEIILPSINNYQKLQSLMARLDKLEQLKRQEIKYLDNSQDIQTSQSISRAIKYLSQELIDLQINIKNLIASNKNTQKQSKLLISIIGINNPISWRMIAYLGDSRTHPLEKTVPILSIPKLELKLLCTSIYFPTIDAIEHNAVLKKYFQHLTEQGKTKKQAIMSIMKMFATLSYSVLTSGHPLQIQPLSWIKV